MDAAVDLHPSLATAARSDNDQSKAYSEFLGILVNDTIEPSKYDKLDAIYKKTKLKNLAWGDIGKDKRRKIKVEWKKCCYDFSMRFRMNIVDWWAQADLYGNSSRDGFLDMRLLAPLPVKIMVNGFNGRILNCGSSYHLNIDTFGTKWTTLEVAKRSDDRYLFDTAWSPVTPICKLIPSFVANALGKEENVLSVECDLYYYEEGCAFQGINDESHSIDFDSSDFDDDDWEDFDIMDYLLPEIAEAFAE